MKNRDGNVQIRIRMLVALVILCSCTSKADSPGAPVAGGVLASSENDAETNYDVNITLLGRANGAIANAAVLHHVRGQINCVAPATTDAAGNLRLRAVPAGNLPISGTVSGRPFSGTLRIPGGSLDDATNLKIIGFTATISTDRGLAGYPVSKKNSRPGLVSKQ